MLITPEEITELAPNEVFVFGSNDKGLHMGGAARAALKWGAQWGNPVGIQGQTYAIPTLFATFPGGLGLRKRKVQEIAKDVVDFIDYAAAHPANIFYVTPIGCGIAGFSVDEIAPLFGYCQNLRNVALPQSFIDYYESQEDNR